MTRAIPAILAIWLLLPTLAASWIGIGSPDQALATLLFGTWLLVLPLVLLGSARGLFLFWLPVGMFAPLQLYLIYFFGSVPGDAVTAAALLLSPAQAVELLGGFGWLPLMLPAAWMLYFTLWRKIPPAPVMPGKSRKALAAMLLLYAMVGMHAHRTIKHYVDMPALFNETVAATTYPASAAMSLQRVLGARMAPAVPMAKIGASAPAEPNLVILIIGESARTDHFGLNGYARNTTPELAKIGPDLLSFADVATSANYTHAAVPNLVSGDLGGRKASLVSVFREAGFKTAWFSNQWHDLYTPDADINEFADGDEQHRQDADLLPRLESCLKQCGPRQFIVLHTYGSHFPYDGRYRARDTVFKPIFRNAALPTAAPRFREELVNSYDNSLLETDRFIAGVIARAGATGKPAIVLYTSDHGENLYDDERELFMHLGVPSRADTMVPLFVWTSPAYRTAHPARIAALRGAMHTPVSHRAVMPTLLDMAGVDYPGKDPARSLASGAFRPAPRRVQMGGGGSIDVDALH